MYYVCAAVWAFAAAYLLFLRRTFFVQKSVLFVLFYSLLGGFALAGMGWLFSLLVLACANIPFAEPPRFSVRAVDVAGVAFRLMEVILVFIGSLFTPIGKIYLELKREVTRSQPAS